MSFGLRIYIIYDGITYALKLKDYIPKKYNRWYFHFLMAITITSISFLFDYQSVLGIGNFILPTSSNHPTLQVGDRVVADYNAYTSTSITYGDLVAFDSKEGSIWIFRVVGLPGDQIELNNNIVSINGVKSKETYVRDTADDMFLVSEYIEEFPNGHKHHIYKQKTPNKQAVTSTKPIVLDSDSYYLLGDNRDNALDSRYRGTVDRDDIIGQIKYKYWSNNLNRIGSLVNEE